MFVVLGLFKTTPPEQKSKPEEIPDNIKKVVSEPVNILAAKNPEVKTKLETEGLTSAVNFLMKNKDGNIRTEFQELFINSARKHGYVDDIAIGNLWLELEKFINDLNASRISAFADEKKKADAKLGEFAVKTAVRGTQKNQAESDEEIIKERDKFMRERFGGEKV